MGRGKGKAALDMRTPQTSRATRSRTTDRRRGRDQRMLSVRETADLGGITVRSVNKAIEQGVIDAHKIQGQIRIPEAELTPIVMIDEISKNFPLALSQKRNIRDWIAGLPLPRLRGVHELELAPRVLVRLDAEILRRARDAASYAQARDRFIIRDPETKAGEPIIRGTRLTVSAIAARLDGGDPIESVIEDYPHIPREAIDAAVIYARTHPRRGRPPQPWREQGREVARR